MTFDDFVRRIGDRLAAPASRRDFVGTVGAGAVVVGAGGLAGCGGGTTKRGDEGFKPVSARRYPPGIHGQDEVAVCYSPVEVIATEAGLRRQGHSGVAVRKGPSFEAEITLNNAGDEVFVPEGTHFARQSRREAPHCGAPSRRPAVNGFIWGYPADDVRSNKSGWIPLRVNGTRYAKDDPHYRARPQHDGYLCGPASKDFDCRTVRSQKPCGHDGCGGPAAVDIRCRSKPLRRRVRQAVSRRASNFEDYYLRLAFNSTAFGWVEPGDEVFELCRKSAPSYGRCCVDWSFVEVIRSEALPEGTRGWILETGLARRHRKPISRSGPPERKKH